MKFMELVEGAKKLPNGREVMDKWIVVVDDVMSELEIKNKELYDEAMEEMYVSVYGEHFNEEMATSAVEKMKASSSSITSGQHWTVDEAKTLARQQGVDFSTFNEYDWYWTLNMVYNDYAGVVVGSGDNTMFAKMAKAFLKDVDAPKGKAYRYYKAMCY